MTTMKKQYITPETQAVKVQTSCLLAASDPAGYDSNMYDYYEVGEDDEIL